MAVQLFGAIDVGSYEIGLTISECSKKNGIREIDHVSHRINLGTDTFRTGKISYEHVGELKALLSEYRKIMDSYGVKEYRAYGTSAIREMVNSTVVLDGIPAFISMSSPIRSSAFWITNRLRREGRASPDSSRSRPPSSISAGPPSRFRCSTRTASSRRRI